MGDPMVLTIISLVNEKNDVTLRIQRTNINEIVGKTSLLVTFWGGVANGVARQESLIKSIVILKNDIILFKRVLAKFQARGPPDQMSGQFLAQFNTQIIGLVHRIDTMQDITIRLSALVAYQRSTINIVSLIIAKRALIDL